MLPICYNGNKCLFGNEPANPKAWATGYQRIDWSVKQTNDFNDLLIPLVRATLTRMDPLGRTDLER